MELSYKGHAGVGLQEVEYAGYGHAGRHSDQQHHVEYPVKCLFVHHCRIIQEPGPCGYVPQAPGRQS